jgi:Ca2+-binding RTX toxin-like protein
MSLIAPNSNGRVICKTFASIQGVDSMNGKKHEYALVNQSINRQLVLVGSATFLSFLLLLNIHFFNSGAMAQRLNSRTNETQDLGLNSTNLSAGASQVSTKLGSSGDDLITGTDINDLILGLQGSDSIRGEGGADVIQGDEDPDKLYGGDDNDIIQGGQGSDLIFGEMGDDILTGGLDDDMLSGDNGNDKLYGGEGDDVLQGGLGADYFDCGDGIDIVIDSNVSEGDDSAGNCEELLNNIVLPSETGQLDKTG